MMLGVGCTDQCTRPAKSPIPWDFPNRSGFTWTYATYDSIQQREDTLKVTVLHEITLPDGLPATAWEFASASSIDTQYVSIVGDTVRVMTEPGNIWGSTKYVFPLQVGSAWSGDGGIDSSRVVAMGTVTVPAGSFTEAYRIEQWGGALNDYWFIDSWFVPHVGLVFQYRWEFGFSNARITLSLTEYSFSN
jgi:hypothetical protein